MVDPRDDHRTEAPRPVPPPRFETRTLTRIYRSGTGRPVRALDAVSVRIPVGSYTVLTGPSGSGKTTLLAIMGALDRPTSGQSLLDGYDLDQASEAEKTRLRRRMGFVFQNDCLIAGLPAWENVTYPLIPRGVPESDRLAIARELLSRLEVDHRMDARPAELSGGELQRVAVARALAGDPEIVLADEPTARLDEATGSRVREVLDQLHARGRTLVLATHDPLIVERATQVIELGRSDGSWSAPPTGRDRPSGTARSPRLEGPPEGTTRR